MALKGFLASGFQKLIGASRIKGANDQWVGEHNSRTITANTVPIPETLFPGFNIVNYTGTSAVTIASSNALFSVNPTTPAQVIIRNSSTNSSKITIDSSSVTGGLQLNGNPCVLHFGDAITCYYDTVADRWREICRTPRPQTVQSITISASGSLNLTQFPMDQLLFLSAASGTSYALTSLAAVVGGNPAEGTRITIMGASTLDEITSLTLTQTLSTGAGATFKINGDFNVTKFSSITIVWTSSGGWIEICRTNLSYGA